jgi:hypothetical protein
MTNTIQSAAGTSRPRQASQPDHNPNLFPSENRQNPKKPEDMFFLYSPFGNFYLFNMLIINRLNRAKIGKPANPEET